VPSRRSEIKMSENLTIHSHKIAGFATRTPRKRGRIAIRIEGAVKGQ
jgi:hypothetical protein